jgi:hypothetical protein
MIFGKARDVDNDDKCLHCRRLGALLMYVWLCHRSDAMVAGGAEGSI